jgi:hypothetical protein
LRFAAAAGVGAVRLGGSDGDRPDAGHDEIQWDRLIAELVVAGIEGGSWDAVERRTTIPRYRALQQHWRRHPRAEWLIAGYLGFKPPADTAHTAMSRGRAGNTAPSRMQRGQVPPSGALQTLFASRGGQPGKTVVL